MRAFIIIFALGFLAGCDGGQKNGFNTDGSTSGGDTGSNGSQGGHSKIFSQCHVFSGPAGLSASLGTVNYSPNDILLNFLANPNGFQTGGVYIRFQKYKVMADNSTTNPEDVQFLLEDMNASIPSVYGPFDRFDVSTITTYFQGRSIGQMQLTLEDLTVDYQILRINLFQPDGLPLSFHDVLLPEIDVNPNTFATSQPSVIHSLHPNWSIKDLFLTPRQYLDRLNTSHRYCN